MVSIEFIPNSDKFEKFNTVAAGDAIVSETLKLVGTKHNFDPHKIGISKKDEGKYVPLDIYKSFDENKLPQGGTIQLYIHELEDHEKHHDEY